MHLGSAMLRVAQRLPARAWRVVRIQRGIVTQAVPLSMARLEQLLEAEITTLALRTPRALTMQTLLEVANHSNAEELAQLLHEELPVHFAQRIKMLEALPDWRCKPSISSVRQMYLTSFKELRLADPDRPAQFTAQICAIKERHAQTNLLVGGFKQYAEVSGLPVPEINDWLDKFFTLRLSTQMLMSHYLQISSDCPESIVGAHFDWLENPYRSSIDPECNVSRIAEHAASIVTRMSLLRYGIAPAIEVRDHGSEAIPFIPKYLLYIVSELLKNAVRATVESHTDKALPPVHVAVSGDELGCCCRISDEGGGIPQAELPKVWSYLYTTAEPIETTTSRKAVDAPVDPRLLEQAICEAGHADPMDRCGSPIAGLGCGLPLSRLYAKHFGGSVELQSMPRFGTDAYVYINRLTENVGPQF
ncbi:unnamed protein product [Effrenium voratum]|nr:unnamed protein product [Effrenium voratum]